MNAPATGISNTIYTLAHISEDGKSVEIQMEDDFVGGHYVGQKPWLIVFNQETREIISGSWGYEDEIVPVEVITLNCPGCGSQNCKLWWATGDCYSQHYIFCNACLTVIHLVGCNG